MLVLSLCACGGSGEPEQTNHVGQPGGLMVGYARESIMPTGQVNLSGSGDNATRISNGFLDILYATCIAVSENGNTVLL